MFLPFCLLEPGQHKILDFWVILLLLTLGPDRRKAAEAMLRKQLAEGHAEAAWMERAIAGHEVRRVWTSCRIYMMTVCSMLKVAC